MFAPAAAPPPADALSCFHARARCHVLCAQASFVAVGGSCAYVTGQYSNSLVVIDISDPASPVIRGSVVSSSLLEQVRDAELRPWLN